MFPKWMSGAHVTVNNEVVEEVGNYVYLGYQLNLEGCSNGV